MSGDSKIEWCDKVWNPVTGCTKVGEGCRNCYAERMSKRLKGRCGYSADNPFKVTLHHKRLEEPLKWRKPQRVFVCSMGDLFHEDVPDGFIDQVFAVMALAKQHTFLILTKRPERMWRYITALMKGRRAVCERARWMFKEGRDDRVKKCMESFGSVEEDLPTKSLKNVHLGVSVEDQATADERIPLLLQTPAAKRFVSYEPALGPVNFTRLIHKDKGLTYQVNALCGGVDCLNTRSTMDNPAAQRSLDQIIMGGESGPKARPMHPDWARWVRDQCKVAGVVFFFKQHGEFRECTESEYMRARPGLNNRRVFNDGVEVIRVGKKAAGALLDGKEYKEVLG